MYMMCGVASQLMLSNMVHNTLISYCLSCPELGYKVHWPLKSSLDSPGHLDISSLMMTACLWLMSLPLWTVYRDSSFLSSTVCWTRRYVLKLIIHMYFFFFSSMSSYLHSDCTDQSNSFIILSLHWLFQSQNILHKIQHFFSWNCHVKNLLHTIFAVRQDSEKKPPMK